MSEYDLSVLVYDAFAVSPLPRLRRGAPGVLVVGELNLDLIASGLRQPPKLGTELEAERFEIVLGSASAIFAGGVRRLGHPTTFVGKVGDDAFGRGCVAGLRAMGVDTRSVQVDPASSTGVTLCLSTRKDRALVTYPGAMAELGYADVPSSAFDGPRHLHLSCFALQKRLRSGFGQLLRRAKHRGMTTSFDPNSSLRGALRRQALALLAHVDLLFLNELEARELSGKASAAAAASALSQHVSCAVVKLGPRGALLARGGKVLRVAAHRVRVVDTTGAGDSFAAGFVSEFLRGAPNRECLRIANACGALSTRGVGGTATQASRRDLTDLLRRPAGPARSFSR